MSLSPEIAVSILGVKDYHNAVCLSLYVVSPAMTLTTKQAYQLRIK